MNETTISETSLTMTRRLQATPARVFEAWTTQAALERWFCPSPEMSVKVHALDVREGGSYRLDMLGPGDEVNALEGRYRVVDPPRRLVFTWRWLHEPDAPETVVTVELRPVDEGTELRLTHEQLPDGEATNLHAEGWEGCLAQLETFL